MLAILASAVAIVIASFVAGRAFLFALGRTRPTWLSGAVGFAVLVVVCPLLIHLPGRATTATILTILALLISLAAMRSRFFAQKTNISEEISEEPDAGAPGAQGAGVSGVAPDGHPQHGREDGAMHGSESDRRGSPPAIQPVPPTGSQAPSAAHATALATVLITLLLACLPFLLNNSTGVLGEGIYTNDQAAQLYWTDWLQNGDGPEPSAVRFGYPTGPQSLTAVAAEATGASLEHAFDGLLVAIAILGALAALSVLGELEPRRRVAAAVVTGLPYLGASFLAQSAFKETAMGLLVLALAIVLVEIARGDVPRRAGIGALQALAAASVFTYSRPGLIWFAAAIPLWIVFELLRGSGRVRADLAAGADAIRSHRRLLLLGLAAVVVVAVLGAGPVRHFFSKISSVQSSPGRLGSPISPGEVFG
ncbi:MAG: hypothetical protein QOJ01_1565, partial [Solirubrobacterales bacterium]|nr:hypothetical protein [Solirubrobacterales bacterium]